MWCRHILSTAGTESSCRPIQLSLFLPSSSSCLSARTSFALTLSKNMQCCLLRCLSRVLVPKCPGNLVKADKNPGIFSYLILIPDKCFFKNSDDPDCLLSASGAAPGSVVVLPLPWLRCSVLYRAYKWAYS